MKVDYPAVINGKTVVISQECATDTDVFEFIVHMEELYGDMVCKRSIDGKTRTSDKVKLIIRQNSDEDKFYEAVCYDTDEDLKYSKKKFGVKKKGDDNLFPKNKDEDGNWRPWVKYNKETGVEE